MFLIDTCGQVLFLYVSRWLKGFYQFGRAAIARYYRQGRTSHKHIFCMVLESESLRSRFWQGWFLLRNLLLGLLSLWGLIGPFPFSSESLMPLCVPEFPSLWKHQSHRMRTNPVASFYLNGASFKDAISKYSAFLLCLACCTCGIGSSQARGPIRAVAVDLCPGDVGSEPCLQPAPQPTGTPDPRPTERGQGWNPHPRGYWSASFLLLHSGNSQIRL